jgi:K+-sensing histidine kinase KdpD
MVESQDILNKQIFAVKMTENLINDLLDLGKMQNNAFNLSEDYFSLSETIHQAFEIISATAATNNVKLVGMIDSQKNLDFVQKIYGD